MVFEFWVSRTIFQPVIILSQKQFFKDQDMHGTIRPYGLHYFLPTHTFLHYLLCRTVGTIVKLHKGPIQLFLMRLIIIHKPSNIICYEIQRHSLYKKKNKICTQQNQTYSQLVHKECSWNKVQFKRCLSIQSLKGGKQNKRCVYGVY